MILIIYSANPSEKFGMKRFVDGYIISKQYKEILIISGWVYSLFKRLNVGWLIFWERDTTLAQDGNK